MLSTFGIAIPYDDNNLATLGTNNMHHYREIVLPPSYSLILRPYSQVFALHAEKHTLCVNFVCTNSAI